MILLVSFQLQFEVLGKVQPQLHKNHRLRLDFFINRFKIIN